MWRFFSFLIFLQLASASDSLNVFWGDLQKAAASKDTTLFRKSLDQESIDWFDSLEDKVLSADSAQLAEASFHEAMAVLGIRIFYRNESWDQLDTPHIMAFLLEKGILKTLFGKLKWSTPKLGEYDDAYVGLQSSPSIGILFFKKEFGLWKFDLMRSLPLATRGLKSVMVKQQKTQIDAILGMVRAVAPYPVGKELLDP